jgi:hypothetical protein
LPLEVAAVAGVVLELVGLPPLALPQADNRSVNKTMPAMRPHLLRWPFESFILKPSFS